MMLWLKGLSLTLSSTLVKGTVLVLSKSSDTSAYT